MADLMQQCKDRHQARREEPKYAAAIKAEAEAFIEATSHLYLALNRAGSFAHCLAPEYTCASIAEALELIDHQLTIARSHTRAVRRAAAVIQKRRHNEERGVFKV